MTEEQIEKFRRHGLKAEHECLYEDQPEDLSAVDCWYYGGEDQEDGISRQVDPRWSDSQIRAYMNGYMLR